MSNKENKKINPLSEDQLENTTGGQEEVDYWIVDGCTHPDKTPTNEYKEEPYFIFWTRTVRKWHCNVCNQDVWLEVK